MTLRIGWHYSAVLLTFFAISGELNVEIHGACDNKQFVELGKVGTIKCSFQKGFYGVYWYNSGDVTQNPFFYYEELTKSGEGFETGEFDVESDGSLVIRNVSLEHDHTFTVAILSQKTEEAAAISIEVVVVVAPRLCYPIINLCLGENSCYQLVNETPTLTCVVENSRPQIRTEWYKRTIHGDHKISFEESAKLTNERFTSLAQVTNPLFSNDSIEVLVCKAVNVPPLLTFNESIILLEHSGRLHRSFISQDKLVENGSKMVLKCGTDKAFVLLWKKSKSNETTLISGHISGKTNLVIPNLQIVDNGNLLIIHQARMEDEGTFTCTYSDEGGTSTFAFLVSIYVHPVPRYPVVEGCSHNQYCVIRTESEGKLKCNVSGIRPAIQLRWNVLHSNAAGDISFFNEKLTISQDGDTNDVSLTTHFRLIDTSLSRLTVECVAHGIHAEIFNLSTQLDLMFLTEDLNIPSSSNTKQNKTVTLPMSWLMVAATLISTFVLFLLSVLLIKNGLLDKLISRKEQRNQSLIYEALAEDNLLNSFKDTSLTTFEENNEDPTSALSPENFLKLQQYIGMNIIREAGVLDLSDVEKLRDHQEGNSATLLFFQRLISNDNRATTVFRDVFQDEAAQINLENDEQLLSIVQQTLTSSSCRETNRDFSCRDALFAIYHSCKLPLRYSVVSKMSELQLAIPLLLPDPFKRDQVALLLSDLRNVKKVWTESGIKKNARVSHYPFPTVATMRIGDISVSKGRILNTIIGRLQDIENPSAFIKSNDDNRATVWSTGTVEAVWFLPNDIISDHDYALPVATCFLNLRGKMQTTNSRPQERFLSLFAMCVIIFIEKSSFNKYYDSVINTFTENTSVIVVVVSDKATTGQNSRKILRKGSCLTVIVCERCSELRIAIELCKEIVKLLKDDNKHIKTLDTEGKLLCKNLSIGVE